jgi:hypothetical protein
VEGRLPFEAEDPLGALRQEQELAVFSGFLLPTFLCRGKEK